MSTHYAMNVVPALGQTPNPGRKMLAFSGSLVAMYFSMWLLFGSAGAVIITISIFVHELGHFLAFRSRGYTAGMVFLPFLGAAVYPDDKERFKTARRSEEVMIAISGPFSNVMLIFAGLFLALSPWRDIGLALAAINAVLASINLLPFGILDGGHVARAIFISADDHHDRLIVRCLTFAGLIGVVMVIFTGNLPIGAWLFIWGSSRSSMKTDRYAYDHPRSMSNAQSVVWGRIWAVMMGFSLVMAALLGYWKDFL